MYKLYIVLLSVFTFKAYGQDSPKTLSTEMARLKAETVLIVQSQAIDEYPLWSRDSDFIACNISGEWYKFRLTNIHFETANFRGQTIGVLSSEDAYSKMSKKDQAKFKKVSKLNQREVRTKDGTKVELRIEGVAVTLVVTKKGEEPKTLWTSGGENCHSLVLSPDGKYVAYLCELNGLLIMKIK